MWLVMNMAYSYFNWAPHWLKVFLQSSKLTSWITDIQNHHTQVKPNTQHTDTKKATIKKHTKLPNKNEKSIHPNNPVYNLDLLLKKNPRRFSNGYVHTWRADILNQNCLKKVPQRASTSTLRKTLAQSSGFTDHKATWSIGGTWGGTAGALLLEFWRATAGSGVGPSLWHTGACQQRSPQAITPLIRALASVTVVICAWTSCSPGGT